MGKLVIGYDLETGASFDVDPSENWITELGAVLWDIDAKMPVKIMNTLVWTEGKEVSEEAQQYTGITTEQCNKWGVPLSVALDEFALMAQKADYVMAHNGRNFDEPVLDAQYKVVNITDLVKPELPLIDTMTDIPYPSNCMNRNLTYLAGFHLVLNSFPHRAVSDVLTMLTVFSKYDWDLVEEIVSSPIRKYSAKFDYPNERRLGSRFPQAMEDFNKIKNAVKGLGFKWHPDTKRWVLETREALTKDMVFPCPVNIIE